MSCPDTGILGENLTFSIQASDPAGSPVDTDSLPTYKIYENATDTEIVSGTMAKLDDSGTTGFYSETVALTAALGYERFKTYTIRVVAAIDSVAVVVPFSFLVYGESDTVTGATGDFLTTTARFKNYAGITGSDDDTLIGLLVARATNAIQKFCNRDFVLTTYREFYDGDLGFELTLHNFPVTNVAMLGVGREDAFMIKNTSADAYNAYVSVTDTKIKLVVQGGDNADDSSLTLADYATLTLLIAAITALDKGWQMILNGTEAVWSAIELLPTSKGLACLDDYATPKLPQEPTADFHTDNTAGILKFCGRFPKGFENIVVRYTAGFATIPADLEQICIDLVKHYYDVRKVSTALKGEKIGDYSFTTFSAKDSTGGSSASGLPADIAVRLQEWRTMV